MILSFLKIRTLSLYWRMVGVVILAALVPMLVLTLIINNITAQLLNAEIEARQLELTANTAHTLSQDVGVIHTELISTGLFWANKAVEDDVLELYMRHLINQRTLFQAIWVTDSTGEVAAYLDARPPPLLLDTSANQAEVEYYFQAARLPDGDMFMGTVRRLQSIPYLTVSAPVRDGDGELLGIVAASIQMEESWAALRDLRIGEAGYAYLLDGRGNVIYNPNDRGLDRNLNYASIPPVRDALTGMDTAQVYTYLNPSNVRVQGSVRRVEGTEWILVVERPTAEAFAAYQQARGVGLAAALLTAALLLLLGSGFSRTVVAPIHALTERVRAFQQGDYSTRLSIPREDEIGELAQAFNHMASRLEDVLADMEDQITVLEAAESALRESEDRYRGLFENSPVILFEEDFSEVMGILERLRASGVTDMEAHLKSHPEIVMECLRAVRVLDVNQATLEATQATDKSQLLGQGKLEVLLDTIGGLASFQKQLAALAAGKNRFSMETVNRTFSGGTIFLALQLSIAPGYQDTWERVLVSLMDISELRMAEERIRRYARRIEVFRDLDQAILATHSLTEVIHLALDRLLELVPARSALLLQKEADGEALSILYARPPEVLSPGDLSRMKLEFSWFKDQTSPDSSGVAISPLPPEAMPSGKDSVEVIALSVPLSYPEDLPGLLCVCLPVDQPLYDDYRVSVREIAGQISIALRQADLSEQVRDYTQKLEDRVEQRTTELRAANQQLRELTRIKDEFVGNVSHELRTPITSLKLYHHLLELNPDRWMDYRMVLRRETARLEHLIEGLLLLSRLDQDRVALTLQTVNLGKLAADLTEDRRAVIEAQGLTLITDLEAAVPPAYGDPKLIEQVISILLTNAINYTPAGGEVRVLCRGRDEDHRVGITVSDTGRGIPPEDLKSVFERFYRGLAARETNRAGTGLGLAIAREIVERHQGEIEITSPGIPGQGTVCTVWFPTTNGTG